MTIVATRGDTFSAVFKDVYEAGSGYCFDVVTVNLAAGATLVQGTVLALVSATGKYVVQDASALTGAGLEAAGVLVGVDELTPSVVCATTTDTKVLMLARGPAKVVVGKLVMAAGTDTAAEKLAVYDALAAKGIVTVTAI